MTKNAFKLVAVTALAYLLGACGGGGGGDSSTPTTPTTPAATVLTLSGTPVVTGVAAAGAPLLGANVRVLDSTGSVVTLIDAAGTRVPSLRTSTADGSYRLTLAANKTPLPLFLQASGVDGTGTPVVLHSVISSNTLPLVAHITPITDALVGMVLGAAPKTAFAQSSLAANNLPLFNNATAVTSASDLIKTVLATNLTDAKVTNSKTLDFLNDSTFLANRAAVDAVLDGLKIQVVKSSGDRDLVQLTNKFLTPGAVEVTIDLANARAELLLGATGSVAKSITSTLKVTSSAHKVSLLNLATIDALTASINGQIAQGASSATFTTALLSQYTQQDGRSKTAMAALLADYALNNLQLGRWTLVGCVEDPIPTKGCTKFQASALVINSAGQAVGVHADTLGNDTSKPVKWTLLGNGRIGSARVQHIAQLRLNLDGSVPSGGPLPSNGLQLLALAQDNATPPNPTLLSATVQVPSGYGVRLVNCGLRDLCVSPGPTSVVASGELSDTLLQQTPGWVGSQDAADGAVFAATLVPATGANVTHNAYLRGRVASDLSATLFPKPDTPLNLASVNNDALISWRNWAEQNPDMQVQSVRLVSTNPTTIRDFPLSGPMSTSVLMPAPASPITNFQLWIGAQDSSGRLFYSQLRSGQ